MNEITQEPIDKINFFILTGGPGSGKTTVLNELARLGYLIVPEAARRIIKNQQMIGGDATHAGNRNAFCDLMLEQSITDYRQMDAEKRCVFFDRGIPDLYGYASAFCSEISTNVKTAIAQFRYNNMVFIFPPWQEIYKNDRERKQDFQEAIYTYVALKKAYSCCDYDLVEIPKVSINQRVDFILKTLMLHKK